MVCAEASWDGEVVVMFMLPHKARAGRWCARRPSRSAERNKKSVSLVQVPAQMQSRELGERAGKEDLQEVPIEKGAGDCAAQKALGETVPALGV